MNLSWEGWSTFLNRKEVIIITQKTGSTQNLLPRFSLLSTEELQILVHEAQLDKQESIDKLCQYFKPLINKEARRLNVYNALGEDAENVAWVVFLSFIRRYNGADYKHLPGLIQCHLRYELLHEVQKAGELWDNEVEADEALENQTHEPLEEVFSRLVVRELLRSLPSRQHKIFKMYLEKQANNLQIARELKCSLSTVKRQKLKAVDTLKEKLKI